MLAQILFVLALAAGIIPFSLKLRKIMRNINLGLSEPARNDRRSERWMVMTKVALGQSKMVVRPVAGIMHILIYVGFVIINLEVLEIILDGIFGTHRMFAPVLGGLYDLLIGSFEWLAIGVLLACFVFLIRRNVIKLKRFFSKEMSGWPRTDANLILIIEILLMTAFLMMNATDSILQSRGVEHYSVAGYFPVSSVFASYLSSFETSSLILIERTCWWFHILGIFAFLNYIPYSKHFHIFLAFPNTWYSKLEPKGEITNMESVTNEVKLMMDPSAVIPEGQSAAPVRFGAKDVNDLSWKSLMDAYSCTECGRCTSVCPANITGKALSPRKIMMDTRDRLEEYGDFIDKNPGHEKGDGKSLLHDYIKPEEVWACTTCNACVEACPVNIDPVSIIVELRRNLVMEESSAPSELNAMFSNIENNGAPWPFSPADRFNWKDDLNDGK